MRSQSSDVLKITRSTDRNQDIITKKSSQPLVKLKSTFIHGGSLSKPRVLPSIVEGVEMRLNLEMSHKKKKKICIEEDDKFGSKCTSLPTSDSTLVMVKTTTTTVATTLACSPFSDSPLSSMTGKAWSTVKKIQ